MATKKTDGAGAPAGQQAAQGGQAAEGAEETGLSEEMLSAVSGHLGLSSLVGAQPAASPADGAGSVGEGQQAQEGAEGQEGQDDAEGEEGAEGQEGQESAQGQEGQEEGAAGGEGAPGPQKLTPEQQAAVDRRIGQIVAQREQAREQLQAEQAATAELRRQVADLQGRLQQVGSQNAAAAGMSPVWMAETEADVDRREAEILNFRQFARKYRDGFPGSEDGKYPEATAEEIQERLEQLEDERQFVLPKVRDTIRQRQQVDGYARGHYPELFDPASREHQVMQGALNALPGLRQVAGARVMIGDMLAGERLRMEKDQAARGGAGGQQAAPPARAPRLPTGEHAARRPAPTTKPPAKKDGVNVDRFIEAGADRKALEREALSLLT